jgi:spore maturation protein CgeB
VLRLFGDGEQVAAFTGGEELRARVEALLRDETARRRLAQRGRETVLAGHTYGHRAAVLIGAAPAARLTGRPMDDSASGPRPAWPRAAGGRP